ncbi:MAG: alanine:cation symporter family protein [Deltaproteobacteria bacterium]|nr:alanine:cation symporter family protein [Deltaproteobacteria bacterium]
MPVGGKKAEPKEELKLNYGSIQVEVADDADVKVKAAGIALGGLATGDFDRWAGPAFRFADGQASAPPEGKVWKVVQGGSAPFAVVVELGDDGKGTLLPILVSKTKLAKTTITAPVVDAVLEKGAQVWVGDATCNRIDIATVESVNKDGSVLLTSTTTLYQTGNPIDTKVPIVVLWLVLGSLFFTLKMGFINVRAFTHALSVVKGDYDNPEDEGEITHFQALSSALSATVGLGNIAGVAIAVSLGGPGALFWMIMAGSLGMTSKFVECTLGQLYRRVNKDGVVLGGPMQYLKVGLAEFADEKLEGGSQAMLKTLGTGLAWVFAIMCIGGSFGGGNMFQGNQTFSLFKEQIPSIAEYDWAFGLVLSVLVGLVIIGGIKRIGAAASFLVPTMVGGYMLAGLYILVVNAGEIPWAIGVIVGEAFTPDAGFGGMVGVLILGFKRAAFSNEAGVGSAAIAHSAAATDEPVREGIVALLGPFIDTIVVCTMTGLVIVITRAYQVDGIGDGVLLTSLAFKSALPWFPWLLTVAVALFAFSTMISWSYYGERCATMLFGENASLPYRLVYCVFAFLGPVLTAHNVVGFSDLMILGMAFPNILGVALLSGKVKSHLNDYWGRYKAGEIHKTK